MSNCVLDAEVVVVGSGTVLVVDKKNQMLGKVVSVEFYFVFLCFSSFSSFSP